jgi:hypothetical protein
LSAASTKESLDISKVDRIFSAAGRRSNAFLKIALFCGLPQYCSLKYLDAILDGFDMFFPFPTPQWVIAHLAFDASRIPAMATRHNAFFKDFIQNGFMKSRFLLRGE